MPGETDEDASGSPTKESPTSTVKADEEAKVAPNERTSPLKNIKAEVLKVMKNEFNLGSASTKQASDSEEEEKDLSPKRIPIRTPRKQPGYVSSSIDSASEAGSECSDLPLRRSLRLSYTKDRKKATTPGTSPSRSQSPSTKGTNSVTPTASPKKAPHALDIIYPVAKSTSPSPSETSSKKLPTTKTGKRKYKPYKGLNYSFGYKKKRKSGPDSPSTGPPVLTKTEQVVENAQRPKNPPQLAKVVAVEKSPVAQQKITVVKKSVPTSSAQPVVTTPKSTAGIHQWKIHSKAVAVEKRSVSLSPQSVVLKRRASEPAVNSTAVPKLVLSPKSNFVTKKVLPRLLPKPALSQNNSLKPATSLPSIPGSSLQLRKRKVENSTNQSDDSLPSTTTFEEERCPKRRCRSVSFQSSLNETGKSMNVCDTSADEADKNVAANPESGLVSRMVNGIQSDEASSQYKCLCLSDNRPTYAAGIAAAFSGDDEEFATTDSSEDLYCQANDSLDGRVIGCCKLFSNGSETQLVRPSIRVPFQGLCKVHERRMLLHQCCPNCGLFCTQGTFMVCKADPSGEVHLFHRRCHIRTADATPVNEAGLGAEVCVHCGAAGALELKLCFETATYLVYLPQQMPTRKTPAAKMSMRGTIHEVNEVDDKPLPECPISFKLPGGQEITSSGLPSGLEKEKLDNTLASLKDVLPSVSTGSSSSVSSRYTTKALFQAVRSGDVEKVITVLAHGVSVHQTPKEHVGHTALHVASAHGHLLIVHVLLQAGAQRDAMDREQLTPMMCAVEKGGKSSNNVLKYLVTAGADVGLKGRDGMTILHMAARSGNLEACQYIMGLVGNGKSIKRDFINAVDSGGWTALVWSAEFVHVDVAHYLLSQYADPFICDVEKNIALHWAAFSGSMEILTALLGRGCDINAANVHGDTPLHIAARQNKYDCVLVLLSRGADVTVVNCEGDTPKDCCQPTDNGCHAALSLNLQLRDLNRKKGGGRRGSKKDDEEEHYEKILCNDITKGKEQNPIQCINSVDDEPIPTDYMYVTENCFTSAIHVDTTITSLKSCDCTDNCSSSSCFCGKQSWHCWYNEEGKLLSEFNYTDPPMVFECNRACACNKASCNNRVVQHGVTVRMQLIKTPDKGWGVKTLKPIEKGSYVCEYIGELISDLEADQREDDSYLFDLDNRDGETYCIDARRYGNVARFINHMCDPNLIPVKIFVDHQDMRFPRIAFFAARDIEAYEELGFDYGEKFWIIKYKSFTCTCGSDKCKYSTHTISQTLEAYQRRLQMEEDAERLLLDSR